jgi:hypothetical protein
MLLAKETGGGDFELTPAGTFQARCYMIVDLGTQENATFDPSRKIKIVWEIDELMKSGKPFSIGKDYTLSLSEKAHLRKDLEGWRNKVFTREELDGFDVFNVINAQCMLNIVHDTSAKGKTYAKVQSIMSLPKSANKLEPVNPEVKLCLEPDFYSDIDFEMVPEWIQTKIKQSPEWQDLTNGSQGRDEMPPLTEDDIPF